MRLKLAAILLIPLFALSCAGAPPPVPVTTVPIIASPPPPAKTEPPVARKAEPVAAPEAAPLPSKEADEKLALAKERREYILQAALDSWAPQPFAEAEKFLAEAEAAIASDRKTAEARLDSALPLYEKTISEGFAKKLAASRLAADEARKRADAGKAKAAAKEEYAAASGAYDRAKADAAASRLPQAIGAYEEAVTAFDASAKLASDRREEALLALQKADRTVKATEERLKAIEAEIGKDEGGVR